MALTRRAVLGAPGVLLVGLRNDPSGSRRARSVAHVARASTFNWRLRQRRGRAFSHADQSPAANARARHHPAAGRRRQPPCHVRGWRHDRVPEVDQRPGFSSAPRQPTRSTQSTAATPSRAATTCKHAPRPTGARSRRFRSSTPGGPWMRPKPGSPTSRPPGAASIRRWSRCGSAPEASSSLPQLLPNFPIEIRGPVYTTNGIESLNAPSAKRRASAGTSPTSKPP
jgi:hypothetical protein